MRGTHTRLHAQLAATLLAFASLIFAYGGMQMDNGPLRAALILGIIVLATAGGSLVGLGIAHRETLANAKDDWEKGGSR